MICPWNSWNSLLQIREVQIKWMVDVTVVAEDIVVRDLDHGSNEFHSFSSKQYTEYTCKHDQTNLVQ